MTTKSLFFVVLAALMSSALTVMASPTPEERIKEIGCVIYPATTRTPFCTPQ
ncbi:hypothetical protein BD408DRAFT_424861 [Parasitella parasitica]|nr:hypothetical protein BD408DRAFT_424861 [Parasitella parasitica]